MSVLSNRLFNYMTFCSGPGGPFWHIIYYSNHSVNRNQTWKVMHRLHILAHIVMPFKKGTKTCVCSWWSILDPILLVYFKIYFLLIAVYIWLIGVITETMLILTLFPVLDNVPILSHGPFPKDLTSYFLCEALSE